MKDLGVKLNPITKLKLFRAIKNSIFSQMDKEIISVDRAEKILEYVEKYILDIATPQTIKQFYTHLWEKFSELKWVKQSFEIEEKEKIDQLFSLLLDEFMKKNNLELASEIMGEMENSNDEELYLEKLEKNYPIEFQKALKKIW